MLSVTAIVEKSDGAILETKCCGSVERVEGPKMLEGSDVDPKLLLLALETVEETI